MFEHVNGEAELLIRYGASGLEYGAYESEAGDYLSVEILNMGRAINAYGLYRLYAGCDGEEYRYSGATVLAGDYTWFAITGRSFLRINADPVGEDGGKVLVEQFLADYLKSSPEPDPLPALLPSLQQWASKPCEVHYHPENLDYDLGTGPGYRWVGPDGDTYYLNILPSETEARLHAETLEKKGVPALLVSGSAVIWIKDRSDINRDYLDELIGNLGEVKQ